MDREPLIETLADKLVELLIANRTDELDLSTEQVAEELLAVAEDAIRADERERLLAEMKEPTEEMIAAIMDAALSDEPHDDMAKQKAVDAWHAAIAAAIRAAGEREEG